MWSGTYREKRRSKEPTRGTCSYKCSLRDHENPLRFPADFRTRRESALVTSKADRTAHKYRQGADVAHRWTRRAWFPWFVFVFEGSDLILRGAKRRSIKCVQTIAITWLGLAGRCKGSSADVLCLRLRYFSWNSRLLRQLQTRTSCFLVLSITRVIGDT